MLVFEPMYNKLAKFQTEFVKDTCVEGMGAAWEQLGASRKLSPLQTELGIVMGCMCASELLQKPVKQNLDLDVNLQSMFKMLKADFNILPADLPAALATKIEDSVKMVKKTRDASAMPPPSSPRVAQKKRSTPASPVPEAPSVEPLAGEPSIAKKANVA